MSRMAVLTLANGCRTFSKVMGFASAQPILRASPPYRSYEFLEPDELILPDGQITSCFPKWPVQPLLQKYFRSGLTQIRCISKLSRPSEGRSRVVTSAGRDAVDVRASGMQWQSQGEMNLVSGQLACKMIGA